MKQLRDTQRMFQHGLVCYDDVLELICMCPCVRLSVYWALFLPLPPSLPPSLPLSLFISIYLYLSLSIHLSVCLFVCQTIYLPIYLCVCLCVNRLPQCDVIAAGARCPSS
jgi:hypothetical protein